VDEAPNPFLTEKDPQGLPPWWSEVCCDDKQLQVLHALEADVAKHATTVNVLPAGLTDGMKKAIRDNRFQKLIAFWPTLRRSCRSADQPQHVGM
jgi:hypothetical protein